MCSVPTSRLPSWIVTIGSLFSSDLAAVRKSVDDPLAVDASRIRRVLGMHFRDMDTAVIEMAYTLIHKGIVPDKSSGKTISNEPAPTVEVNLDGIQWTGSIPEGIGQQRVSDDEEHAQEGGGGSAAAGGGGGRGGGAASAE